MLAQITKPSMAENQRVDFTAKIVTLCGSTKFRSEFHAKARELALDGCVVFGPEVFSHAEDLELSAGQVERLDALHKRKIVLSDEIYVLNIGGYIGYSTHSEILFAKERELPVIYHEEPRAAHEGKN